MSILHKDMHLISLPRSCWWLVVLFVLATAVKPSELPWIRLTNDNFYSEIQSHPLLLCLATVPWCGESRSLMRELSESLSTDENLRSLIQLRVVYLNMDRGLETVFSQSKKHPSFTVYWHSTPLKYRGKLRLPNILTAINRAVELTSRNMPLPKLETAIKLKSFMASTDKAVILFDFCGYKKMIRGTNRDLLVEKLSITPEEKENVGEASNGKFITKVSETYLVSEMLDKAQQLSNATTQSLSKQSGMTKGNSESSTDNDLPNAVGDEDSVQDTVINCDPESGFAPLNARSFSLSKKVIGKIKGRTWFKDNIKTGVLIGGEGCNRTQFSGFAKVYQQLISVARSYVLTPELANFGIIEDKNLLSTWGLETMQNYTWLLMQWMPDWPDHPQMYYGNETLQTFLFGPKWLVNELSLKSINSAPSICNNTVAVVLFIDMVSPAPEVRRKCFEAKTALRAVASEHIRQESLEMQESNQPIMDSADPLNEESNLHSRSFTIDRDVLLKLLVEGNEKQKVDASLFRDNLDRKELGKVFLSKDKAIFEIQEANVLKEVEINSAPNNKEDVISILSLTSGASFKLAKLGDKKKEASIENEVMEEQSTGNANHERSFSFYCADGEDQWKEMVHPGLPYPSLVILDPFKQGKFIFPTLTESVNYTSLKTFLKLFLENKLNKAYSSEEEKWEPRKLVEPPFVNRDFHEVDGVPRVSAERLQQLLVERSRIQTALLDPVETIHQFWERAALVLFTYPSCGFCQRMELVFREVYHLLGSYLDGILREGPVIQSHFSSNGNTDMMGGSLSGTDVQQVEGKMFPHLLQIDCSMNDCSGFFESIEQVELYPSVILYPAHHKHHPVMFKGLATVQEILEFMALQGVICTKSLSFFQEGKQHERSDMNKHLHTGHYLLSQSVVIGLQSSSPSHTYQFSADTPERPSSLRESDDKQQKFLIPIVYPTVGSVLLATDLLSNVSEAFKSSKILIVKADGQEGFQGLILNKPLLWKRKAGLMAEMEHLVNRTMLCYGGPVFLEGKPFFALSRVEGIEGFSEVLPGVHVGGPAATMHVFESIKAGTLDAADFWLFLGHAVWGWQQLLNEIEQQFWNLTSFDEVANQFPIHEWLQGSIISVADLLERKGRV